jgi:hypothetical protein
VVAENFSNFVDFSITQKSTKLEKLYATFIKNTKVTNPTLLSFLRLYQQ